MHTKCPMILVALIASTLILLTAPAFADFAPLGRHHAPLGNGAGVGAASVSATGTFSTVVPLDLPKPRGDLPDPVAVVHHGGNHLGEAGVGWSIPLSYIFRSTSVSRRKPVFATGGDAPRAATRVFMSLGGSQMLMSLVVGPNLYRPFASDSYSELRGPGPNESGPEGQWVFMDSAGRRYLFESNERLGDPTLWLLTRVTDSVGNKVTLRYWVRHDPDDLVRKELNLIEVAHSHLAGADDCPKYRISLKYAADEADEPVLGYRLDHGKIQVRRRLLEQISVRAQANACDGLGEVLRTYQFSYVPDSDSGRPRLDRVNVSGRGDDAGPLPVASYTYGSARTGIGFEYKLARTVSYPAGTPSIGHMSVTQEEGLQCQILPFLCPGKFETTSAWVDFTGDGRPDFVRPAGFGEDPGGLTHFVNGPDGTLTGVSQLNDLEGSLANLAEQTRRELKDWAGGRVKSTVTETWQDMIDWNGDGRMDIVQARGALDKNHWLVLLSFPSSPGFGNSVISWVGRQVNIKGLRLALKQRGHEGIRDDEPLPLSRAQTVGRYGVPWCIELDISPCFEPSYNRASQKVTEWKLQDVNGDGFPDFLLNSEPISEIMDPDPYPEIFQEWVFDTTGGNSLLVYYNNNGAGLANPALTAEFTIPESPTVIAGDACGVERWSMDVTYGYRRMNCGFREINGDGLIDRIIQVRGLLNTGAEFNSRSPEVIIPGYISQRDGRERTCRAGSDYLDQYYVRTRRDLVDLTGDGIPDLVFWEYRPPRAGWWVRVGTGVDFGPHQPLEGEFEISLVQETCKQKHSVTLAGLVDFDGDGFPDVVRPTPDNSLEIQRLGAGSGTLSAGRLTGVYNGYGGATRIRYANAKADAKTAHQVPFPEVVVTRTREVDQKDLTRSFDPVHFAYGEARLQYNPILARWTFPGYGRRVTVRGVSPPEEGSVAGTAIVEQYLQPDELPVGLQRYVLAGRLKSQKLLVGFFDDAWSVDDLLFTTGWWQGALDVEHAVLDTNAQGTAAGEECGDIDPISFQLSSPTLCQSATVISLGETRSWRGKSPPPSPGIDQPAGPEAVEVRSRVTKWDEFGRSRSIEIENDTARTDDDACVYLEYATSDNLGLLGVLDAVSIVRVSACTEGFDFSGQRYRYDNLPEGRVSRGLPTNVTLERYNASTGASLGEINAEDVSYDTYGNVEELSIARSDGVKRTTTFRYDPFGLALSDVSSKASDVSLAASIGYTRDPTSLLPQFVEDGNGAIVSFKHDSFGRTTRTTLIDPADQREYMLGETVYLGDDPAADPMGRRVSQRSFDAWMLTSAYTGPTQGVPVRETTTYFDSFGRPSLSKTPLGVDYGKTLIEGERLYDELGRIRFLADTYVEGEAEPYGTSYLYGMDGSLSCVVRGIGYQTSEIPNAATDRYPTCFVYSFSDRQSVLLVRGPEELGAIGPQAGAFDEKRSSAIGWQLSQARLCRRSQPCINAVGHGVPDIYADPEVRRLEYATYSYDHLGQLKEFARSGWPDNTALTGPWAVFGLMMNSWSFVHDSLGQTLSIQEPGSSPVTTVFDDWGSPVATTWDDSIRIRTPAGHWVVLPRLRGTRSVYDGFGRLKRREATLNGESDPSFSRYDYFYDVSSDDSAQDGATYLSGRLAWVSDKRGDDSDELLTYFGYDALGRANLIAHQDTAENQSFVQRQIASPMGDPLAFTLQLPDSPGDETIWYNLDSAGRVKTVNWDDSVGSSTAFHAETIDPLGRYLSVWFGNGVSEKYSYRADHRRELLSVVVEGSTFRRERTYVGYDGEGRVRQRRERCVGPPMCTGSFQKTAYSYDALNRLARAETFAGPILLADQSFKYDAVGNLNVITDAVLPTNSRVHPSLPEDPDRICRTEHPDIPGAGCSFSYDSLGNVLRAPDSSGVMRNFAYDAASRVVRMSKGSVTANLRYGAFGEVSQVDQTGSPEDLRRDRRYGPLITKSRFGAIDLIERRIPGPMGTVALRRGSGASAVVVYAHADPNANRSFSGNNGEETQAVRYRPFGAVAESTGVDGSQPTFVGELWNGGDQFTALGVTQLGARFYDPALGRFLQRDPLMSARSSNRANPYAFAFNDPVNFIDPSGLEPEGTPTGVPVFEGGWFSGIPLPGFGGSSGSPSPEHSTSLAETVPSIPTAVWEGFRASLTALMLPHYPPSYMDLVTRDGPSDIELRAACNRGLAVLCMQARDQRLAGRAQRMGRHGEFWVNKLRAGLEGVQGALGLVGVLSRSSIGSGLVRSGARHLAAPRRTGNLIDEASQHGWRRITDTSLSATERALVDDVVTAPSVVVGRSINIEGRGLFTLDNWVMIRNVPWSQRLQDVYNYALFRRTSGGAPVNVLSGGGWSAGEAAAAEAGAAASGIRNIPYWPN